MAVGAGQPHVEFRLGWSGLIAQAAESMGARLVIDELSRIASDGRLPSAATRSRATAEGQERDLEEGFTDPQRRPQGDQGRCAGCVSAHSTRLSHSVTFDRVCLRWRRQSTLRQDRRTWQRSLAGDCCGSWRRSSTTRAIVETWSTIGRPLHFVRGEDSSWRAPRCRHQPGQPSPSTLLVVARATAV